MSIDNTKFRELTCNKCRQFTGEKLVIGKCLASPDKIFDCAKMRLFNHSEFANITGIEK